MPIRPVPKCLQKAILVALVAPFGLVDPGFAPPARGQEPPEATARQRSIIHIAVETIRRQHLSGGELDDET